MTTRFTSVVLTYFVIGALLWATGLVEAIDGLGVVDIFFDLDQSGVETSSEPDRLLSDMGGALGDVAAGFVGPVLAVWNVLRELVAVLFWPVTVLVGVGAPAEAVVILGGTPTVAFFMGVVRFVRESA